MCFAMARPRPVPVFFGKRPRASSLERSEQGLEIRRARCLGRRPERIPDPVLAARDSNLNPGPGLAVLDRVFDQVIEDLAHLYRIQQDRQWFTLLDESKTHLFSWQPAGGSSLRYCATISATVEG